MGRCARSACECGPLFGFLARVLGAHVLDIVVCEIAGLKRHCNPVHGRTFLRAKGRQSWARSATRPTIFGDSASLFELRMPGSALRKGITPCRTVMPRSIRKPRI